jgi:hypothetical protein
MCLESGIQVIHPKAMLSMMSIHNFSDHLGCCTDPVAMAHIQDHEKATRVNGYGL